jgi:hypothetical protein
MRPSLVRATLVVSILAAGGVSRAQGPTAKCPRVWHRFHKEGTPPAGKPRFIPHTDQRAGHPRTLAKHIEPSTTPGGIGYYAGGGVALGRGHSRRRDEGTWGWDETGRERLRHRVVLRWSQGRKYQGGTGSYPTDGHVPPDFIYAATSTVNSLGRREGKDKE